MARKIDVTHGEKEYVTARVTEKNGADLSGVTFTVGLSTTRTTPPTSWQAPDAQDVDGSTATVSLLIDDAAQIGVWYLWAKVTDNPEVILLDVGGSNDKITVV